MRGIVDLDVGDVLLVGHCSCATTSVLKMEEMQSANCSLSSMIL